MKYSIIIPTYNKLEECLKPCLESIIKYTDLDEAEVLIISNGCKDGTGNYIMELQEKHRNIKLTSFKEAIGYTQAANIGLKSSFGKYKVLLNNDTVLLPQEKSEWLRILEKPFETPRTAITGPMKEFSESAGRDFLIFFCVMINRDCMEEVGYLDEVFSPGYGEDTDWCCRAEDLGWRVVQVPDDTKLYYGDKRRTGNFPIYHAGNVTFKNWPEGDKLLEKNEGILRERFNKITEAEPPFHYDSTIPSPKLDLANKTGLGQFVQVDISKALECDGFMTDLELTWLAEQATKTKTFIEIGSWHGKSSRAIADNLPEDGKLYCVDTWKGSQAEQDTWHQSARMQDGDHAFIEFTENLYDHIQSGKVVPLRMSSKNASELFKKKNMKADVIFIDAGHTYPEIKEDIGFWESLVKEGGILCGHDYYHNEEAWPGVRIAVDELFGNKGHNMGYIEGNSIWAHKIGYPQMTHPIRHLNKPDVYDCFPFFNELDLLEVRFNELYDVVDRFVITEATLTHGGKPKPLYFAENLHRYQKFLHKVTHIVVDEFPALDSWSIERHQRDSLRRGLGGCKDNDIILMGDADEIPKAEVIKNYKQEQGLCCISQSLYYYYLDCKAKQDWDWLRILPWSLMKTMDPCQVRYTVNYDLETQVIKNGGWHFSYLGGLDAVIEKLEASAHQEYNTDEYKNRDRVKDLMHDGVDLLGRNIQYEFVEIDCTYPQYIIDNKDKYQHLIANKFELV